MRYQFIPLNMGDAKRCSLSRKLAERVKKDIHTYLRVEPETCYPSVLYKGSSEDSRWAKQCIESRSFEAGDVIVIHGEGQDKNIWAGYSEEQTYSAEDLARYFASFLSRDIEITFDLMTCNSGTLMGDEDEKISCFAKDFSRCLSDEGFKKSIVLGYTGFITEKRSAGKYSCSAEYSESGMALPKKTLSASLVQARRLFRKGVLVKEAARVLCGARGVPTASSPETKRGESTPFAAFSSDAYKGGCLDSNPA